MLTIQCVTSDEGMEAVSLFLQGDATISRKYTVGVATPTNAGNPGDVVYNANPAPGGILGWTSLAHQRIQQRPGQAAH